MSRLSQSGGRCENTAAVGVSINNHVVLRDVVRDYLEAECVVLLYTDHTNGVEEAMRLIQGRQNVPHVFLVWMYR